MVTFWQTDMFHRYESACGVEPGTRTRLLAEATWDTRVVDLSKPEAQLWSDVRASYHSLVHRWHRVPGQVVTIHTRQPFERPVDRCRALHLREAGRETRPRASWDVQAEWVRAGHGVVALAHRETETGDTEDVAFAFVARDGAWAYYFSAASTERDVQHAVQWAVMRYLRSAGVRWYELGWQGQGQTPKEQAIEFFRRGWGGQDVPAGWPGWPYRPRSGDGVGLPMAGGRSLA